MGKVVKEELQKEQGQKDQVYREYYSSPAGELELESDGEALTGLWFSEEADAEKAKSGRKNAVQQEELPVFRETKEWLRIYFEGRDPGFTPRLRLRGSEFKQMVAEIMLRIPFGELTTYGDIAREVAERTGRQRMSAQAVGGAVGHNDISIIIPCHRVVGSSGSLTGYGGGMDRKVFLLQNEHVDLKAQGLFRPPVKKRK